MELVNVVATVTFSTPIDLQSIHERIEGTAFSSGGGGWLKFRIQPENLYIAFYKSGKFLVTGPTKPEKIDSVARRVIEILRNAGFEVEATSIDIHNVVAKDKIVLTQTLEDIAARFDTTEVTYEPEQFPALLYKASRVSILLFSSGSIIVAGASSVEEAAESMENFKKLLN